MHVRRSNCLVEAVRTWFLYGGRFVVVERPSLKDIPWSLLPHFGVEVTRYEVVHFRVDPMHKKDCPLWFRGKLHRDWMGPA